MAEKKPYFWLVWNGVINRPPSHRHYSKQHAIDEAKRLSSLNPNGLFYVMKAVDAYVAEPVNVLKIKLIKPDDIPF